MTIETKQSSLSGATVPGDADLCAALFSARADIALIAVNREGQILRWSRGAEDLYRAPAHEAIGQSWTRFHRASDTSRSAQTAWQAALDQGHFEDEGEARRLDGTTFPASVTYLPWHEAGGSHTGFVLLTRARRNEGPLPESETKYRTLVETAHDLIWSVDLDGRWTFVNRHGARSIFGCEPEEMIGRHFTEFEPPDRAVKDLETFQRIKAGESFFQYETENLHKDGSRVIVSYNAVPWYSPEGRLLGTTGTAVDITERKAAEEALRSLVQATATVGADFFLALVRELATVLSVDHALVAEILPGEPERMRTVAVWAHGQFTANFVYSLAGSPCANVIQQGLCYYPIGVQKLFPDDSLLQDLGIESYLGIPLRGADGQVLGLMVVLHHGPLRHERTGQSLLRIFASRAAAELQRLRAEAALHEQAERLRLAVHASNIGLWDWDLRLNQVIYSSEWKQQLGYEDHEIGNDFMEWEGRVHPEDLPIVMARTQHYLAHPHGPYEAEFRMRHRDGSWRWIYARAEVSRVPGETARRMLGCHVDITARKQAEQLFRDQALLAAINADIAMAVSRAPRLDGMLHCCVASFVSNLGLEGACIWTLDEDGQHLDLKASAGQCGPAGRLARIAVGQHEAGLVAAHRKPHLHNPEPTTGEPDPAFAGHPLVIDDRLIGVIALFAKRSFEAKILDTLGIVASGIASGIERKRLQDAVAEEVQFTSTMMEALPGVVLLVNEQQRPIKWNRLLERVTGQSTAELARRSAQDFFHPDDWSRVAAALAEILAIGYSSVEARLRTQHGGEMPHFFSGVLLRTDRGNFSLMVGLDVTERKRLEEQLRQSQKMEAFGQLAGGVAHDFNNLLTIISGYSDLLLTKLPGQDTMYEAVKAINDAGQRAAALTGQMLAFSRRTLLAPQVLNVNEVVLDTERMLRRMIGEDVHLQTVLQPDVAPVRVDRGQLGQVLMNLAVNARDAMPRGGTLKIETSNTTVAAEITSLHAEIPPGEYVRIAMSDTGSGIDPEVAPRIFEPFFTTKEVGKGSGLGLAVVHGIVQQSGGHIDVESEPGRGSVFKIYLPATTPEPASASNESSQPAAQGSETILLAEDDEKVRRLARTILEQQGYHVLAAADGLEALTLADQRNDGVDLLVTDVVMPGMGGAELANVLQRRWPRLKVLFLSGYTDDAVIRHGILHEEVAFLQKPFSPVALSEKVRLILDEL